MIPYMVSLMSEGVCVALPGDISELSECQLQLLMVALCNGGHRVSHTTHSEISTEHYSVPEYDCVCVSFSLTSHISLFTSL